MPNTAASLTTGSPRRIARRAALLLAAVVATLTLVRCDLTEPVDADRLVVEAFVETERPLPPVLLRSIRSLESTGATPAEGADVTLTLGSDTIPYEEMEPGRYRPADPADRSRVVSARQPFSLTVRWQGERATARGSTPPPIRIEEVCLDVPDEPVQAILVDSLRRDSLDIPAEQGYVYPVEVRTRWSIDNLTPADTSTWVRAELEPSASLSSTVVNFFLQPAEVRRERAFPAPDVGSGRRWTGVYAYPVDSADAPLPRHRVAVALVRGDTAWADFASSRTDPDRREPISNVEGAVGIATGVAIDSLSRRVSTGAPACTTLADPAQPPRRESTAR